MKANKTLFLLVSALVFTVIFSPEIKRAEAQAFKRVDEQDIAPDFSLKDVEGNSHRLSELKGKVTGLVFWSNPSLRCAQELEIVQELYLEHHETKGFSVLAVYIPRSDDKVEDEELSAMQEVLAASGATYPNVIDVGMKVFNTYGVITFPSYAVVNEEGRVGLIMPGLPTFGGKKLIKRNTERLLGIEEIQKIVKKQYQPKGKADFYYNFAHNMYVKGFDDKALSKLEMVFQEDPEYYKPYRLQAIVYTRQKKMELALAAYNRAVELAPKLVQLRMELAQYYVTTNQLEEALKIYQGILEGEPESADAHYGLGVIFLKEGKLEEARQELVLAKDLFQKQMLLAGEEVLAPTRGDVHRQLADIYSRDGDLEQAYLEYTQACSEYKSVVDIFLPQLNVR